MSAARSPIACSALAIAALALAGCASTIDPPGELRKEDVVALTASHRLVRFNAGRPGAVSPARTLSGLATGETLVGIDYRVARGVLYALGASGRLYTLDVESGVAKQVGSGTFAVALDGARFGFDFNPAADRIRVVSDRGQSLRLHPDTGAIVDGDPATAGVQGDSGLAYAAGDRHAGIAPRIVAAAYTYNKTDEKITTNFAIDAALGALVTQGSREGVVPAVSPNAGQLFTVGPLGIADVGDASFDIADTSNVAIAAVTARGASVSRLYRIDLTSGAATLLGTIGGGETVRGIAIVP